MSIINDALKKAEKDRDRNKNAPDERAVAQEEAAVQGRPSSKTAGGRRRPDPSKNINAVITTAVTLGLLSLMILAAVTLLRQETGEIALAPIAPAPPPPDIQAEKPKEAPLKETAEANPKPEEKPAGEFVLEGIIHGEGMPMALINGSVYMEGDAIDNGRVIKISEDTVVLDNKGRIIELRVR